VWCGVVWFEFTDVEHWVHTWERRGGEVKAVVELGLIYTSDFVRTILAGLELEGEWWMVVDWFAQPGKVMDLKALEMGIQVLILFIEVAVTVDFEGVLKVGEVVGEAIDDGMKSQRGHEVCDLWVGVNLVVVEGKERWLFGGSVDGVVIAEFC